MDYLNEIIKFTKKTKNRFTLIEFELTKRLEPSDLPLIKPPDPVKERFSTTLVILSGRGPIWLYGYLIHFYHPTKGVAVYDPRYDGAIVVETHTREFKVGDLIKKEEFE
ncbi:MAG: CRISPR-associated ring nuclease Crn3/Csx3 [bacterium]